ncbi:MAG: response regulator, partial [Propionivibrio sp.]
SLYLRECKDLVATVESSPKAAPTGAGQRLLVIDDDPVLLALGEEVLRCLGYEPCGFSDPAAALAALQEDPEQFAAVITDEVMPGFSGTQLTAALRQVAPRLPVLLISGYGGAALAARAATAGVTRVLTKPVPRAELARALAELLQTGDTAASG